MDFALEVDWGSKTEQEFQDGSVSVASAVLASPRRGVLCNAEWAVAPLETVLAHSSPVKELDSRPTSLMEGALKSGFARLAFCHPPEQHR